MKKIIIKSQVRYREKGGSQKWSGGAPILSRSLKRIKREGMERGAQRECNEFHSRPIKKSIDADA